MKINDIIEDVTIVDLPVEITNDTVIIANEAVFEVDPMIQDEIIYESDGLFECVFVLLLAVSLFKLVFQKFFNQN